MAADPTTPQAAPGETDDRAPVPGRAADGFRAQLAASLHVLVRVCIGSALGLGLLVALAVGGLYGAPTIGMAAAPAASPPQRPPIVPPAVPLGAREDWAVWSYTEKVTQAWGKDWPLAVQWLEELYARYPRNAMARDKLYAAYVEDGRALQQRGDIAGARRRYEQAIIFDPDRGEAADLLARLDAARR